MYNYVYYLHIKYNPNKIYEFEIRYKSTDGASDTLFFGFTGWKKDKVTKVSAIGTDSFSNQHYVAANNVSTSSDDGWRIARGYVSGYMRDDVDTDTASYGGDRPDPMNHARAYQEIEYFSPHFIVNYNGTEGRTFLDYVKVTEYTSGEETHAKVWSSLITNNYKL